MNIDIKKHKKTIIKTAVFIAGSVLLIWLIIISGFSKLLLDDKKTKSSIDEGEYILNRLAADYEELLRQKRAELEREQARLMKEKGITLTLAEKQEIQRKIRQIENDKKYLNDEFKKVQERKTEIESKYLAMRKQIENMGSEQSQLSDRLQNLKREKNRLDNYWKDYINDLTAFFSVKYSDEPLKSNEINIAFSKDSGKQFMFNEFIFLYNKSREQEASLSEDKNRELELTANKKGFIQRLQQYQKEVEYYGKYSDVIKKFQNIINYYNSANSNFTQKNYTKSAEDFKKVLKEFDEVKISYENLEISDKNIQNEIARKNIERGLAFIKLKRYNYAIERFVAVIQDTPESIYTNDAAFNIYRIIDEISDQDRIDAETYIAKGIMDKAETDFKEKKYTDALTLYDKVIRSYPITKYVKEALDKSNEIRNIIQDEKLFSITSVIKKKFDDDYKKYEEYLATGDTQKARDYYFGALNKTFGEYSNNTIEKFKKFEDRYIEALIDNYSRQILALQMQKEPKNKKVKEKL